MHLQEKIDFERIAQAIEYMYDHAKSQPDLNTVAEHVHLSPYHFQKMFRQWAGVSPKKFLQYLNVVNAKKSLKSHQASLFDTAYEIGLSGTGRLHDLFVKIEGMTPEEYKNGGKNLKINYLFSESVFGELLVASTGKGICYLAFSEDNMPMMSELKNIFPNALFEEKNDEWINGVLAFFSQDWAKPELIKLHLKGTEFQLKVWETLLKIPEGQLTTYGRVAEQIDNPRATRAVGSAVGSNPVSYLIPCHRVIRSSGILGQYHWGAARKKAMIGWEISRSKD